MPNRGRQAGVSLSSKVGSSMTRSLFKKPVSSKSISTAVAATVLPTAIVCAGLGAVALSAAWAMSDTDDFGDNGVSGRVSSDTPSKPDSKLAS